jgi:hypothetical protein
MMQVNSDTPEEVATLSEGVQNYKIGDLVSGNDYLFYVIAQKDDPDPDQYSCSNGVLLDTLNMVYPEYIHANLGTVNTSNHPEVQFTIYPDANISKYALLRAADPAGPFDTIIYLNPVSSALSYTDSEADASEQSWYYKVLAIGPCGTPVLASENIAGTVLLTASLNNTTVNINWNEYQEWQEGVLVYAVERYFEGEDPEEIGTTTSTEFGEDINDLMNEGHSNYICYRVTAYENPGDPHVVTPAQSYSNVFCIRLPLGIEFLFDAFTPSDTQNTDFGPFMRFIPSGFDFKIFNREGNIVFRSTDPVNTPRWDGRLQNGKLAPQGVYRYTLEFEDASGNGNFLQGNVTLVDVNQFR